MVAIMAIMSDTSSKWPLPYASSILSIGPSFKNPSKNSCLFPSWDLLKSARSHHGSVARIWGLTSHLTIITEVLSKLGASQTYVCTCNHHRGSCFKHKRLGQSQRPDSTGLGRAWEFAFMTNSQVMLLLLVHGALFAYIYLTSLTS